MDEHADSSSRQTQDASVSLHDVLWLILLRWVAVVVVAITLCVAVSLRWMDDLVPPMVVASALGLANAWWHWRARGAGEAGGGANTRRLQGWILAQLLGDLAALTAILHWTGGIENPFASFYVFPVAIATMLLPLRNALLVFGSAFTLFAGLIFVPLWTGSSHHPLGPVAAANGTTTYDAVVGHPVFLTAAAAAWFITLFGIVMFLSMLVSRLRRTEATRRRHEHIALSRERLARVGTLAAGLAHSIRNPLHGALNCISLLRDPVSDAERVTTTDMLEEGLRRIETVTRRLMSMTRETPFSPQPTDLRQWIADFLRPFSLGAYVGKELQVTADLAAGPPVAIDRDRIYESLYNVMSNAIHALPEVGGRVHVALRTVANPFAGVEISVTDNGHGISAQHLARVFDPFFTTKPVGEGTGLGLSIARAEIERHGGEVSLASLTTGGTRVTIVLPVTPFESA